MDASAAYNGVMLESIGKSNITFDGITFTNNFAKKLAAFIKLNSSPNKCTNITIKNCKFINSNVENAILFGSAAANDSTHWTDNVLIENCVFEALYNPLYPTETTDLPDSVLCRGINFNQTTLRATVRNCTFRFISNDGVYGYGPNFGLRNNKYAGNWTIKDNTMFRCGMCLEFNGDYLGNNLLVENNKFLYPTRNGGFCISFDTRDGKIINNKFLTADRTFMEGTLIGGIIAGNTGRIECWKDTSQGVAPTVLLTRTSFGEFYGYDNLICNNNFKADRSNPNAYSPTEFNGFKLIGKTTDPTTQDTTYRGITDYAAYWTFSNNTLTGITHKMIDATNNMFRYVTIQDNTLNSNVMAGTPIEIYGLNWKVVRNTFNLAGSPAPGGNTVIKVRSVQTVPAAEIVADNVLINSAWDNGKYRFLTQDNVTISAP